MNELPLRTRAMLGRALGLGIVAGAAITGAIAWKMNVEQPRTNDAMVRANIVDVVLQHVALLCRKATRTTDLLGRVGGEEFAILLLEAGGLEAKLVAERLRQSIENNLFETEEGAQVSLQVSIGVAEYQIRKDSLSDLMIRADKALYRAKNEGRNRVAELE